MTTVFKTHAIELKIQNPSGDWKAIEEVAAFDKFNEIGTYVVHGEGVMNPASLEIWNEWRDELVKHEQIQADYLDGLTFLWTRVSFRALVIGSDLFAGDEWEPIDKYGALPYAVQWVADQMAAEYKKWERTSKIILSSDYGQIGRLGWWMSTRTGRYYDFENGSMEMKTSVRWSS